MDQSGQVWRTDAFKEERLKKLEVRQLLSCLRALLGTGREEQRVFFKAALEKNNEVNFTAVEALLFVQVAHELKEVAELASFVRSAWSNDASTVSPDEVAANRSTTAATE